MNEIQHKRMQLIILPSILYNEFNEGLKLLECKYLLERNSENVIKNNKYAMQGNTYQITYNEKSGRYKSFCKELAIFWEKFNQKHPKTIWKGK